ncbi:MAG: hypothetical protein Q9220_007517 [cf. Caloplaca sp. 1 TL-2023]
MSQTGNERPGLEDEKQNHVSTAMNTNQDTSTQQGIGSVSHGPTHAYLKAQYQKLESKLEKTLAEMKKVRKCLAEVVEMFEASEDGQSVQSQATDTPAQQSQAGELVYLSD